MGRQTHARKLVQRGKLRAEFNNILTGNDHMNATIKNSADLAALACRPLRGAEHLLPRADTDRFLGLLPGWTLSDDGLVIAREFRFKQYFQTMAFVNAIAWIAHREDHHPDLEVGYSRCLVALSTHDVGGLSMNDFIVAAQIEALGILA
jgi:4a-hydroxytetrahydrobiopterin dehydratase